MIPKYLQSVLTAALLAGALGGPASAQAPATPPAVAARRRGKPRQAGRQAGDGTARATGVDARLLGGQGQPARFSRGMAAAAGDMMVGVSQTTLRDKTVDFEYLRLESRPEGVFYVAAPSGKNEAAFRLAGQTTSGGDEVFTFVNATPGAEFPQRIIYRHASEGWLYATSRARSREWTSKSSSRCAASIARPAQSSATDLRHRGAR